MVKVVQSKYYWRECRLDASSFGRKCGTCIAASIQDWNKHQVCTGAKVMCLECGVNSEMDKSSTVDTDVKIHNLLAQNVQKKNSDKVKTSYLPYL